MAYMSWAERHQQILDAAVDLVSRESLSAATVRRIAQETGCSLGQIHHHYESADALRAEAVREVWQRVEPKLTAVLRAMPPRERLLTVVSGSLDALPEDMKPAMKAAKVLWRDAWNCTKDPAAKGAIIAEGLGKMQREIVHALSEGVGRGDFPSEIEINEVATLLMTASQGYDVLDGLGTTGFQLPEKLIFMDGILKRMGL